MLVERRVSATYKDLPGGQLLGPTFDYTHRLLDPELAAGAPMSPSREQRETEARSDAARLGHPRRRRPDRAGRRAAARPRHRRHHARAAGIPDGRATSRLQALSRGDEGFLLALGYSTQRGYARTHPFVGEIRIGEVEVELDVPELGFRRAARPHPRHRMPDGQPVQGLGQGAAAVHPRLRPGLRPERAQGDGDGAVRPGAARPRTRRGCRPPPAQDEEFVISHSDNVQATGFVEHLKLPHYVDFQAELDLVRRMRAEHEARNADGGRDAKEAAE